MCNNKEKFMNLNESKRVAWEMLDGRKGAYDIFILFLKKLP